MFHDFDDVHAGTGCDGTGFMSYGRYSYGWSNCSRNDFLALYNQIVASSDFWCLEEFPTACGNEAPAPTPAPTGMSWRKTSQKQNNCWKYLVVKIYSVTRLKSLSPTLNQLEHALRNAPHFEDLV